VGDGAVLAVLHPGASAASRRYAPERFAAAARLLLQGSASLHVLVTGDAAEFALCAWLCERAGLGAHAGVAARMHNLAGVLDLGELAALIQLAQVVITNNTGPAHLAAPVGTPVVELYALTNPQHTPWRVPQRVLFRDQSCRYCYKSVCLRGDNACLDVEPAAVAEAAMELLAGKGAAGVALPALAPRVSQGATPPPGRDAVSPAAQGG
jgi:ADP-heptose:LPS heptosyltransferase